MSQRAPISFAILLALLVMPSSLRAQTERRDLVELENGTRLSGKILEESWKGLKLDRLDGKPAEFYELEKIKSVTYGEKPQYLVDAMALREKPEEQQKYIETLKRAYHDKFTSKWILQHAYYDIAKEYETLSVTDETYLEKALDAYQKLLDDIPESRYAAKLRMELGDMFLGRGELERARKNFQGAIGSGFGPENETHARFRQAETYLLENDPDQAQTLLSQINPDGLSALSRARLSIRKADVLAVKGEYAKAYDMVLDVLKERKTAAVEPEAYLVLGDIFRQNNQNDEALLAYLRVHIMYESVDTVTRARALVGAIRIFRQTGRLEKARELQTELAQRCPGPFWEKRLSQ